MTAGFFIQKAFLKRYSIQKRPLLENNFIVNMPFLNGDYCSILWLKFLVFSMMGALIGCVICDKVSMSDKILCFALVTRKVCASFVWMIFFMNQLER